MLPTDIAGYGFDNNADALTLSPALTERYLGAAAKISQMALDAAARHADAGNVLRADRSQSGACGVSDDHAVRHRAAAWRCAITFRPMASTCSRCGRKRAAPTAGSKALLGRAASARHRHRQRQGLRRTGLGGPEWRRAAQPARTDSRVEDRNKKILDLLTFRVPVKAGDASGAGVLRPEDDGASSRICSTRRCAASRIATAAACPSFPA